MKKQQLFMWGVQVILTSETMHNVEVWTLKKLVLDAITASKRIPMRLSAEEAVDAYYLHILKVKSGAASEFSEW